MRRLRYSESAERDILSIVEYIALHSSSTIAARFVLKLRRRCRELPSLPGMMGTMRPELGETVRSRAFGNYIIFFVYERDTLRIVRTLEAHRDIVIDDFHEEN